MYYLHRTLMPTINAFFITTLLLFLMYQLVKIEEPELSLKKNFILPAITMIREEPDLIFNEKKPIRPKIKELPPVIAQEKLSLVTNVTNPTINEFKIVKEKTKLFTPDNSQLVLALGFPPAYPNTALNRGIEGYAVVEFSVNEHGAVFDAFIIESEPNNIFDRASLKAINKFKYKPKQVNGKAVSSTGQRYMFTYKID